MSTQTPPWFKSLSKSYKENHSSKDTIYLPMCDLKRSGDLSLHCIEFKGFLETNSQFFKFILAMNDYRLMGDIKSNPQAKINWMMPKSKEYYNFVGKFYIASAPIQVTRFPPPKLNENDDDFWETQRLKQWDELDPKTRAQFTWPSKGEIPKADDIAFSCQNLSNNKSSVVHDIARDNFCLLIYKVTEVEYFNYATFPPQRSVYHFDTKSHSWSTVTANP